MTTAERTLGMQKDLEELQPVLNMTSDEVSALSVDLDTRRQEAESARATAKEYEGAAAKGEDDVRLLKEECQADVDKALPALNASLEALRQLQLKDIQDLKTIKSPPEGILLVGKALCLLLNVKRGKGSEGKKEPADFWESAKKSVWGDKKLLDKLLTFEKDNIPVETMSQLKEIQDDYNFEPDVLPSPATHVILTVVEAGEEHQTVLLPTHGLRDGYSSTAIAL